MSDRADAVEMAVFDVSGLSGTYTAMNDASSYEIYTGDGFETAIKMLKIYNAADVDVTVSFDGVKRQDFLPVGSTLILDTQANHDDNSSYGSGRKNWAKGQILYGRGSAGTGYVYIIGYR